MLVGIDHLTGSAHDDVLSGNAEFNFLSGGSGDDELSGRGGNDALLGDADDDVLSGGPGDDSIFGQAGFDVGDYSGSPAPVNVRLYADFTSGDGVDRISGLEGLIGSPFDDHLEGDVGANTLDGGGGNDVLLGNNGNDTVIGNTGSDTASFEFSLAGVTADLAAGTATGDGNDVLAGSRTSPVPTTTTCSGAMPQPTGSSGAPVSTWSTSPDRRRA